MAWYLTAGCGPEKWQVKWYARVESVQRMKRIELLPDEPLHPRAEEEYYRVGVGELASLPRPTPSRSMRRIVFIPSSMERLLVAEEINDLFHTSPIEDRLYFFLRELGLKPERQFLVCEAGKSYFLDMALFAGEVKLAVECDGERYHTGRWKAACDRQKDNALAAAGWRLLRFSGAEICRKTGECARVVMRALGQV